MRIRELSKVLNLHIKFFRSFSFASFGFFELWQHQARNIHERVIIEHKKEIPIARVKTTHCGKFVACSISESSIPIFDYFEFFFYKIYSMWIISSAFLNHYTSLYLDEMHLYIFKTLPLLLRTHPARSLFSPGIVAAAVRVPSAFSFLNLCG